MGNRISSGDEDSTTAAAETERADAIITFDDLPTGIYWGFCRIGASDTIYKTACSIGYNPYYGNNTKTVEPHLIALSNDTTHRHASKCGESLLGDFYDQPIRLTLVGYLRPELPFEGIDKLIAAIKQDIVDTERLSSDGESPIIRQEKEWIASNDGPNPSSSQSSL
jgi:riboflavin kinase